MSEATSLLESIPQSGNPAALSPKIMECIARKVSPDMIANGIHKMMHSKLSNGQDDVRAIESGIKLYLNYMVGMPVQRQEIVTHKITTAPALRSLMSDPAVRERIQAELDAAGAQSQ